MFGLKIDNFRSFKDQSFDFSRVNILIGENSSGKSSVIKFLLLLSNSLKLNSTSFKLSSELGRFGDFVHMQENDLTISFTFSFGKEYSDFFVNQTPDDKPEWNRIREEVTALTETNHDTKVSFVFNKETQKTNLITTVIENPYYGKVVIERIINDEESVIRDSRADVTYFPNKTESKISVESTRFEQYGFLSYIVGSELKENFDKKDGVDKEQFYDLAYLLISQNFIREILAKVRYINPIDSKPERVYTENENQQGIFPVRTIKDVVNILASDTVEPEIRFYLKDELNKALKKYGILYELETVSSAVGAMELRVKVNENSIWTNIKDVGYGSSLQIPILFQGIIGEKYGGELIIIEQPEVHVHPYLQAKFIETLISLGNKNTYIIETHSPDIIRKMQVMIKNKEFNLTTVDAKIYYFKKSENVSLISKHIINEHGKLVPKFPSGFYDSSVNLVKELF